MKSWLHNPFFLSLPIVFIVTIAGTIFLSTHRTSLGQSNSLTGTAPQVRDLGDIGDLAETKSLGILLLGYGGPGHSGGFLTDVIQVLHIDFANQKVSLISIPRDLWVTTQSDNTGKINEAFAKGISAGNFGSQPGVTTVKQMASQVTGVPIDYFIGIDFVGLQRVIGEKLHGIDVIASETLDDLWYPVRGLELETCGMTAEEVAEVSQKFSGFELEKQFPCRYEHVYFAAGLNHMEGGDVLAFVRSRHGSGSGDFSRSKRQHAVLQAVVEKLLKLDAFGDAAAFFDSIASNITTDISVEVATQFAPRALAATQFPRKTVILSTENVLTTSKSATGQFILLPKTGTNDWQSTQNFVEEQSK
ncbi:MAG: hypothetical protein GW947_01670 [Candidatus Pacebacteria bacterium]|nr:hypothetical protein [Candidatus Paceibacterota bacterium]PIR59636.1 MAG: hypothetical protein COU68_04540 [Candidatus Pacebacteria bacterium CG10_big_fil_rev_8_21_14_0_10_45_6]